MTSWEEMGANSSDAAIQFHSLPFTSFWLPCCLPCWFLGLIAVSEESYQSSYDFTVQSSPVSIQPQRQTMTAHYAPKIFYQAYSFILAYRQRNSETHKDTQTESLTLPPSHTDTLIYHFIPKRLYTFKQTEETVIVRMQLSCTVHLLDCCGTKSPLLMRLAACEQGVRHPWPFPWLWTFNLPSTHPSGSDNTKQTPEREREKKSDANGFSIVCKSSLICLFSVLRDWSRAVGQNKLYNRNVVCQRSPQHKQFRIGHDHAKAG